MNLVQLAPFFEFCRNKAQTLRDNEGFSGGWGDGGAGNLERMVECYEAGLAGMMPESLKKHYSEYLKLNDPEFADYQRLKDKFEHKA